jgi:hypothetical protein
MLATYTASILAVMGAMGSSRNIDDIVNGKPVDYPILPSRVFKGFYDTATALNYHAKKGNFEKVSGSMFRLTQQGFAFFIGRKFGKGHINVLDDTFAATIDAIKTGTPQGKAKAVVGTMRACKG